MMRARQEAIARLGRWQKTNLFEMSSQMGTGGFESSPADTILHQAAVHYRAGQLEQAEKLYRQALALRPGLADAHASLAATLFLQGRTNEAISAFRKALE